MSILDKDIITSIPITGITPNFLAGMGFARIPNKRHQYVPYNATRKRDDMNFERIKWGYKISLSIPGYSDVGTLNISKVRRVHGKTHYMPPKNHRIETVEQFIEIVNKHQPRETYAQ